MWCLGRGVWGSGLRLRGSEFMAWNVGSSFRVEDVGFCSLGAGHC